MNGYEAYKSEVRFRFARLLSFSSKESAELADGIIKKYGSIENAMCADISEISDFSGEGTACFLKLCASLISRRRTDALVFGRAYAEREIAEYLKGLFTGLSVETVFALFYDKDGRLLSCKQVGLGTVNASEIITRRVVEYALREGAAAVDIAHNHPRGSARPSKDDMNMTTMLEGLFKSAGVELLSHYVVAGQDYTRLFPSMDFTIFDIK